MMKRSNQQIGALGEKFAAEYLKKQGYKILCKNYKCKVGELDLIARDGDEIVFAEVKTRPADPYVRGMYAVDQRKQQHILRTAAFYLAENRSVLQPRMDVIEVELDRDGRLADIRHIKAAFIQNEPYARY